MKKKKERKIIKKYKNLSQIEKKKLRDLDPDDDSEQELRKIKKDIYHTPNKAQIRDTLIKSAHTNSTVIRFDDIPAIGGGETARCYVFMDATSKFKRLYGKRLSSDDKKYAWDRINALIEHPTHPLEQTTDNFLYVLLDLFDVEYDY